MKREFQIKPSPEELAEEFCEFAASEQAEFFAFVADIFRGWGAYNRDSQLLSIGDKIVALPHGSLAPEWIRALSEAVTPLAGTDREVGK